jgi:hypothetical protein
MEGSSAAGNLVAPPRRRRHADPGIWIVAWLAISPTATLDTSFRRQSESSRTETDHLVTWKAHRPRRPFNRLGKLVVAGGPITAFPAGRRLTMPGGSRMAPTTPQRPRMPTRRGAASGIAILQGIDLVQDGQRTVFGNAAALRDAAYRAISGAEGATAASHQRLDRAALHRRAQRPRARLVEAFQACERSFQGNIRARPCAAVLSLLRARSPTTNGLQFLDRILKAGHSLRGVTRPNFAGQRECQ